MADTDRPRGGDSPAWFATTHWSVVLSARDAASPKGAEALERLCGTYWYPLYAFARRSGARPEDAQDLTQSFFADLLRRGSLQHVDPDRGRFRNFILVAFKRFLANQNEHRHAQKRGGHAVQVSWDSDAAELRYQTESNHPGPEERAFERRWAMALLQQTLSRLRSEWSLAEKTAEFEQLKAFLTVDGEPPSYGAAASTLGLAEGAVRVAVHRLRHRFRELFREEIGHTVARPDDIDDEIRHLLEVLAE